MKLRGGSFGLIVTLIVMGVVLLLVAQAWKKYGPTAMEVSAPSSLEVSEEASEAQGLPGLQDARNATDAHAGAVDEALAAIE